MTIIIKLTRFHPMTNWVNKLADTDDADKCLYSVQVEACILFNQLFLSSNRFEWNSKNMLYFLDDFSNAFNTFW
jgi:hypothetical protein